MILIRKKVFLSMLSKDSYSVTVPSLKTVTEYAVVHMAWNRLPIAVVEFPLEVFRSFLDMVLSNLL